MSKSTAATKAGKTTPTITLRASAQPLDGLHHYDAGDTDVPPHVEPFKPFDWTAGDPDAKVSKTREAHMLRELLNNCLNALPGAVLCLRIAEQCAMVGDLGPVMVETLDGIGLEQPAAPYLDANDCAALQSMVATTLNLLLADAHAKAATLSR